MFSRLKKILDYIKTLNLSVDKYKEATIIQSLPSVAYVNKAKKFIEENKLEEAEKTLEEALNLTEKDPLVYKYLGIIYDQKKEHEKAVEAYKKSANICYTDKTIWQKLGFAQIACNDYQEAEKSFENSDKIAPSNSDTYTGWGMTFMKQKKYDLAREKFVQASRINKYNFTSIFLAAVCEIKIGEYKEAEAKLTFLANVCPNETNTYEFANLKYIKKDFNNAKHYAQKSLEFNANMLPSYLLLGKLYTIDLDEENTFNAYNEAESRDLKNSSLYNEWGISLVDFAKFNEAEAKFVRALEFDSENIESKAYLALCRIIQNNDDAPLINVVSSQNPEDELLDLIYAIREYNNNEYENSLSKLRSLTEHKHEFIVTYYLAKINEKINNNSKTIDYFEKTLSLNPKFLKNGIDYVKYLIAKDDYPEAQRKLRKIVKHFEKNLEVLNLQFFVSYILVKGNVCEYNIKESIALADKVISINSEKFEYWDEKGELEEMLNSLKERE